MALINPDAHFGFGGKVIGVVSLGVKDMPMGFSIALMTAPNLDVGAISPELG
jgi:hypothetical protein